MDKYTIKHNIADLEYPKKSCQNYAEAKKHFLDLCKWQTELKNRPIKLFFRDDHVKPMRGQCRVCVDGFFYWIELFITPS